MVKIPRNYRISEEVDALLKAEASRLTAFNGGKPKVSEADVIELSVVRFLSDLPNVDTSDPLDGWEVPIARRAVAEAALRDAESKPADVPSIPKVSGRAESVAQRKVRETREHAESLAESDTFARLMDRDDIEYDLDDVRHRQTGVGVLPKSTERHHYPVAARKVAPLARPHGHTDSKKRHGAP